MLQKNISGQFLYFSLISAISGNVVTGASGSISGTKSLDSLSGMIVLSGNIIELGGGSYRANLYDFDTNGNYAGYQFTASGCVPVQYSLVTLGGISGNIFLGSGSITSGMIASGVVFPTSGAFANVLPATLSGVIANSGLFVSVPPATLSGVVVNSGLFVTVPPATLSGVVTNSGIFATVPIATISGNISNSGLFVTVPPVTLSGVVANSGLFTTVLPATLSGMVVNSGLNVIVASGQTFLGSGAMSVDIPQAVHTWDYSGAVDVSGIRCLLNAERKLINKWDLNTSGILTVYKEDDTTTAYTQNVGSSSGAAPVTSLDTN